MAIAPCPAVIYRPNHPFVDGPPATQDARVVPHAGRQLSLCFSVFRGIWRRRTAAREEIGGAWL